VTTRRAESITAEGIEVELSRTDKDLFPDDRITKGDLVDYYQELAGRMLPYLAGRPLVMARYPDGVTGQRLFQKNGPGYFPDWITRTEVPKQGGTLQQVVCDKPATLVYLANQACIEMHVFTSRVGRLDRPDQVVFDLDPPDGDHFAEACRAALALRDLLEQELGLTTFVKTTGGKGLHVHVPLRAEEDFDEVRGFARQAAGVLAARHPDLVTLEQRKDSRGTRIYADLMRNAYAQTVVAPYSVRARPGAPVAVPLPWEELGPDLEPGRFTLRTVRPWLDEPGREDPWAGLTRHRYGLARAAGRLGGLGKALSDDPGA
jgi:bifunctional non-homologous end joining protein LigD